MNVGHRLPRQCIEDMGEACERIVEYVADIGEVEFCATPIIQDAVLWNLAVLGEAAKHFLDSCEDGWKRFPSIPFTEIYVTRNRLIHGYSSLRITTVWEVASREVPVVLTALKEALANWPADLT